MTMLEPTAAAELVRRIGEGDEEAESELFERCGRTLRFLARRFTRDEADAEDLFQETLMLALEKIRRQEVREPERLAGFLRALVKNLSTQQYRRHRYTREESADALPEAADKGGRSPLAGLIGRERARVTRELLAELSAPRDRDLLFRYYIAEQSSSRICADLALTSDHFYRVLHRARQRYRRIWETSSKVGQSQ